MLTNDPLLAQSIRAKSADEAGFSRGLQRVRQSLDVHDGFGDMGPAKKANQLAIGTNDSRSIRNFLVTGARVNILRQAQYSLPPIASGIQCWISYCNSVRRPYPHPPPTSQRVCAWESLYSLGRSSGQYVAHIGKEWHMRDIPLTWGDPAVSSIGRGLRTAQNLSCKFDKYMRQADSIRFLEHETLLSEFGILGYLSFLFSFGPNRMVYPYDAGVSTIDY